MAFKGSFIFLAIVLLGCSKKEAESAQTRDVTAPAIAITSPSSNQIFTAGQTVQISANATDDAKITELHIHVLNKATGALLRDVHSYPGNKSGTVQDAFTAQSGLTYTIKIIAVDPFQNLSTAQVDISTN